MTISNQSLNQMAMTLSRRNQLGGRFSGGRQNGFGNALARMNNFSEGLGGQRFGNGNFSNAMTLAQYYQQYLPGQRGLSRSYQRQTCNGYCYIDDQSHVCETCQVAVELQDPLDGVMCECECCDVYMDELQISMGGMGGMGGMGRLSGGFGNPGGFGGGLGGLTRNSDFFGSRNLTRCHGNGNYLNGGVNFGNFGLGGRTTQRQRPQRWGGGRWNNKWGSG